MQHWQFDKQWIKAEADEAQSQHPKGKVPSPEILLVGEKSAPQFDDLWHEAEVAQLQNKQRRSTTAISKAQALQAPMPTLADLEHELAADVEAEEGIFRQDMARARNSPTESSNKSLSHSPPKDAITSRKTKDSAAILPKNPTYADIDAFLNPGKKDMNNMTRLGKLPSLPSTRKRSLAPEPEADPSTNYEVTLKKQRREQPKYRHFELGDPYWSPPSYDWEPDVNDSLGQARYDNWILTQDILHKDPHWQKRRVLPADPALTGHLAIIYYDRDRSPTLEPEEKEAELPALPESFELNESEVSLDDLDEDSIALLMSDDAETGGTGGSKLTNDDGVGYNAACQMLEEFMKSNGGW